MSWRRQSGMGMSPLTSVEILAWQQRRRVRFEPWEEDVIDRLDALFVLSHSKKPQAEE